MFHVPHIFFVRNASDILWWFSLVKCNRSLSKLLIYYCLQASTSATKPLWTLWYVLKDLCVTLLTTRTALFGSIIYNTNWPLGLDTPPSVPPWTGKASQPQRPSYLPLQPTLLTRSASRPSSYTSQGFVLLTLKTVCQTPFRKFLTFAFSCVGTNATWASLRVNSSLSLWLSFDRLRRSYLELPTSSPPTSWCYGRYLH